MRDPKGEAVKKHVSNARLILNALGKLTEFFKTLNPDAELDLSGDDCFDYPLDIIRQTMLFDISVLYKVSNIIDDMLILEVIRVMDPEGLRADLKEGRKIRLFMDGRRKRYINEVRAFTSKKTSHINVAGLGCDIMGYVFFPRDFGGAYLVGGDFFGKESGIRDFEVSAMDIMCDLLSTILLKTRFKQKAEVDDLTKLYNSGKIKEEVSRILSRFSRKPGSVAAIAMGGIDFFKKVNDTYGHIQGDIILSEVGRIFSESMREYFDVAGRYGGEEFLLVFDETGADKALAIVERIRKRIEVHQFQKVSETGRPLKDEFIRVTMSFGVSQMDEHSLPCEAADWIGRADNALYRSKQNGRNQSTIFKMDEE